MHSEQILSFLKKRNYILLTDKPLFIDTDFISAFLWVGEESIVTKFFPGRVVVPMQVYNDLSNPVLIF